jgi:hypothetical protein
MGTSQCTTVPLQPIVRVLLESVGRHQPGEELSSPPILACDNHGALSQGLNDLTNSSCDEMGPYIICDTNGNVVEVNLDDMGTYLL